MDPEKFPEMGGCFELRFPGLSGAAFSFFCGISALVLPWWAVSNLAFFGLLQPGFVFSDMPEYLRGLVRPFCLG